MKKRIKRYKKLLLKTSNKLKSKIDSFKSYLCDQVFYLKEALRKSLQAILFASKLTIICLCALFFTLFASSFHFDYIQKHVGNNVVMIKNPEGSKLKGSGTGFEVQSPSGNVYTVTNAHVCELQNGGYILVEEKMNSGRYIPKRVIEVYEENDLCLVEGLPGYSGLSLAKTADLGELAWAVGYPYGQGLNITQGHIKQYADVYVADESTPLDKCVGNGKKRTVFDLFFFQMEVCLIQRHALQTNVIIYPGNSGSPLVNVYGNVIGVIFASDSTTNWGSAVPLDDLRKLLAAY